MADIHNLNDSKSVMKVLKDGVETEFWDILMQGLDDTIKITERKLEDLDDDDMRFLPAEEYKIQRKVLLEKKASLRLLKDLPSDLCKYLIGPNRVDAEDYDVYRQPSDFLVKEDKA